MKKSLLTLSAIAALFLTACSPSTKDSVENNHPTNEETHQETPDTETEESILSDETSDVESATPEAEVENEEETISEESNSEHSEDGSVGQDDKVIPEFPLDMDTPKTDTKEG